MQGFAKAMAAGTALLMLSGCLGTAQQETQLVNREIAEGMRVTIRFQSGHDEPPNSHPIRRCPQARGQLCAGDMPLQATETGWSFAGDGYVTTLAADGTGWFRYPDGGGIAIRWETEPMDA